MWQKSLEIQMSKNEKKKKKKKKKKKHAPVTMEFNSESYIT